MPLSAAGMAVDRTRSTSARVALVLRTVRRGVTVITAVSRALLSTGAATSATSRSEASRSVSCANGSGRAVGQ